MTRRFVRSRRGFTLIEIMIVVSIVVILSWLAMVAIGRIKDRAARTLVMNNLRQLYDAKEYYFAESGIGSPVAVGTLMGKGYITRRLAFGLFDYRGGSQDLKSGWHYPTNFSAGLPTYAYTGTKPTNAAPTGEIIYYPSPPADPVALFHTVDTTQINWRAPQRP
jgi:prepilin-type N-terminal cleavage/methylation domain-containing protein